MTITKAIHTAMINGRPLRFFKSLNPGPHMPWHSQDDLFKCLGIPKSARTVFRKMTAEHEEWARQVRIVNTENGLVTIAPHFMAQGIIGAMAQSEFAAWDEELVTNDYTLGASRAMDVLTDGLAPE